MRHSPINKQTKKTEIQNQVTRSSKELMQLVTTNTGELRKCFLAVLFLACENIRFSPLFAAGDEERGKTRNRCFRRLYCLSSIHPSCILCIFAFLVICDGHAKVLLTIVLSHSLKRPGRASFSLSRNKKINWKPSSARSQENEML